METEESDGIYIDRRFLVNAILLALLTSTEAKDAAHSLNGRSDEDPDPLKEPAASSFTHSCRKIQ